MVMRNCLLLGILEWKTNILFGKGSIEIIISEELREQLPVQ